MHIWVYVLQCSSADRREADAGPGGLLRALGRGGARRLLRRPGRVAGHLGRPRRSRARARGRGRGRAARGADPRRPSAHRSKQLRQAHPKRRTITVERIDPETGERRRRRRSSRRSPASTSSSRARRASACSTRSATSRRDARSARRTPPPGRPRSPTSRTRPASSGAAERRHPRARLGLRRGRLPAPHQSAPRTRTCTRTSSSPTWQRARATASGARSTARRS